MNPRKVRGGYDKWGSELRVKEVILPVKKLQEDGAGPSKEVRKLQEDFKCSHITHSSMKLGEHEITAFCGLAVLEKPPHEDYILGTRQKKCRVRKTKRGQNYRTNDSMFCKSFLQSSDTISSKIENARDFPQTAETLEEKILKRKILNYEKLMKQEQENNYRRQRYLEKESLEQQENLAGKWLGLIQRKKELRKKNLEGNVSSVSPPLRKRRQNTRPIKVSLASGKHWSEKTDEKMPKKPAKAEKEKIPKPLPIALDELKDEFFEKLVFVDDSDDDLS